MSIIWDQNIFVDFNPRPPRGGRLFVSLLLSILGRFQSTPPARGATYRLYDGSGYQYISIHAPREGGDMFLRRGPRHFMISIHAPREGGDLLLQSGSLNYSIFQSTPPARGATLDFLGTVLDFIISIHAPREGGDVY